MFAGPTDRLSRAISEEPLACRPLQQDLLGPGPALTQSVSEVGHGEAQLVMGRTSWSREVKWVMRRPSGSWGCHVSHEEANWVMRKPTHVSRQTQL